MQRAGTAASTISPASPSPWPGLGSRTEDTRPKLPPVARRGPAQLACETPCPPARQNPHRRSYAHPQVSYGRDRSQLVQEVCGPRRSGPRDPPSRCPPAPATQPRAPRRVAASACMPRVSVCVVARVCAAVTARHSCRQAPSGLARGDPRRHDGSGTLVEEPGHLSGHQSTEVGCRATQMRRSCGHGALFRALTSGFDEG